MSTEGANLDADSHNSSTEDSCSVPEPRCDMVDRDVRCCRET
jgi:hypothetical protein